MSSKVTMMRWVMLGVVIVGAALSTPAALAGKPYRESVPLGGSIELPAGVACPEGIAPDGVRLELIGGNQAVTFFEDGKLVLTGRHVDRITNIETGKSVVLDLQGSYFDVPQDDGTTIAKGDGTLAFVFPPGDDGPGDATAGRFYLFTGTLRLVYDGSFVVTGFESTGTVQDVCSMIA